MGEVRPEFRWDAPRAIFRANVAYEEIEVGDIKARGLGSGHHSVRFSSGRGSVFQCKFSRSPSRI
jgi:hypothetical protein